MLEPTKGADVLIMEQSSDDTYNQQERQMDLAWLAGIFEGEGNFSIVEGGKGRLFPRAALVNTDKLLIEEVCMILDKVRVGHYIQTRTPYSLKHKPAIALNIYGAKRTSRFLEIILPFLRGRKKEVAQLVHAYCLRRLDLSKKHYDHADREFVLRVRALNKKGPSESSETIRQTAQAEDIVQLA